MSIFVEDVPNKQSIPLNHEDETNREISDGVELKSIAKDEIQPQIQKIDANKDDQTGQFEEIHKDIADEVILPSHKHALLKSLGIK